MTCERCGWATLEEGLCSSCRPGGLTSPPAAVLGRRATALSSAARLAIRSIEQGRYAEALVTLKAVVGPDG